MIAAVEERLQKVLARAGFASRRGAEDLMSEGRVTVNGETVRELGTKADPSRDDIRVDGVRVKAAARLVHIVLNKPRFVVNVVTAALPKDDDELEAVLGTVGEALDMPDLLTALNEADKRVAVFPLRDYWRDIGRLADLEAARSEFDSVFRG